LREATKLARRLVMEYGMSDLGPMTFGDREELIFLGRTISENRDYGETVASEIDAAVRQFIQNAQESAIEIIQKNKEKLELVAQTLVEKETIEREEFEKLMEKKD